VTTRAPRIIQSPGDVLVLGHRNPDTDASTSAHAYASFLNETGAYEGRVIAAVLGQLPPQSLFVFAESGAEPPPIIDDLYPRVCHVATRQVSTLGVDDRLSDAVEMLIRTDRSMLPVLDGSGRLAAVFSHREDVSRFLFGFDVVPVLGRLLTWTDLARMPGARAAGAAAATDSIDGTLVVALDGDAAWKARIEPDDVLVCGDLGVLSRIEDGRVPRKVILVAQETEPAEYEIARLERIGVAAIIYRHSVLDLVQNLFAQVRLGSLDLGVGPCLGEHDYLKDVASVLAASRHALPVVDPEGRLSGVISRSDLEKAPRSRVILVDHFESGQTAPGIEYAEILEILDHHRVGDLQTASPVRVDCRPLGSSSTIVAFKYFEAGIEPGACVATLLLGGLLSDTLCLRSPTTTAADRDVARRLSSAAGLDVETFGRRVLCAGDDLLLTDPALIWNRDQKTFGIRNRTFAVAQLETASLEDLPPERLDAFRAHLAADFDKEERLLSLLFITDVLRGDSWMTWRETPQASGAVEQCFGKAVARPGWILAKGVVSRKKQVVPPLVRALAERRL
jgi:manganese-dependent inorganic pyrophosphatase